MMNQGEDGQKCLSIMSIHAGIGQMLMIGGDTIRVQTATMLIQSMTAQTRSREVLEMAGTMAIPLLNTAPMLKSLQEINEDRRAGRAGN